MDEYIIFAINKAEILQLIKAYKLNDCPVLMCDNCLIDSLINCNEKMLSLEEIGPAAYRILQRVPQDKLFDIVL